MTIDKPEHPGEKIKKDYLKKHNISIYQLSKSLDVVPATLHKLIKGETRLSLKMALRLSISIGQSAESWLHMQIKYDLWHAEKELDLTKVTKIKL